MRHSALFILAALLLCPLVCQAQPSTRAQNDAVEVALPGYNSSHLPAGLASLSDDAVGSSLDSAAANGDCPLLRELEIMHCDGPMDEYQLRHWLCIEEGEPFLHDLMISQAKILFGQGILTSFEWSVVEVDSCHVDLQVWYETRSDEFWSPIIYYDAIAGFVLGAEYRDLLAGGEDRQLLAGTQFTFGEGTDEPAAYVEYTDQTVNGGTHSYSLRAEVRNDWRQRMRDTAYASELRQRIQQLDLSYRLGTIDFAGNGGGPYIGGGFYEQEQFVFTGDPTGGGALPRSDIDQDGSAVYIAAGWDSFNKDLYLTPGEGRHYSARVEQHLGDYEFTRYKLDLRRYIPLANPLGHSGAERCTDGSVNNIRTHFPAASLGVQLQADIREGDVPYSQEVRLGDDAILRGYPTDKYVGTKVLAARAEYRFALDVSHKHELYVFSDNALIGEDMDDLESLSSVGIGTLVTIPLYGGIKAGGYFAGALNGEDTSYGFAVGYAF